MLSIEEFKKSLGKSAKKMRNADILKLRDLQDRMESVLYEIWRVEKRKEDK